MKEQPKPADPVEPVKDKLEEAERKRWIDVTIVGRDLRIRKWSIRQGVHHSVKLIWMLGKVISAKDDLASILKTPLDEFLKLLDPQIDKFIEILSDTIKNNFKDVNEANMWVESNSTDENIELATHIIKQNASPLLRAVESVKALNLTTAENKN